MGEIRQNATGERFGKVQAAGRGIAAAGANALIRAGFSDVRLVLDWAEIVGADIAALCLPMKLSAGCLTLLAEAGAGVFLAYETRTLAGRINAYLGRPLVKRVKIVPGSLPSVAKAVLPRRVAAETVSRGDPALDFSGPDGLRDALLRLARARHGRTILRQG